MAGFANKCPKCRTAIKIRSAEMDGKKARCPKCSTVFRIKAPPRAKATASPKPDSEEFSFFGRLTDEDLAERQSTGESSDELGEFEGDDELEASDSKSRKRSKAKEDREPEKKMNTDLLVGGLVIGIGMVVFAILGLIGWQYAPEIIASGTSSLAWMPNDTETIWEVRPEPLWTSRAMEGLTKTRGGAALKKTLDALLNPIKFADIDHVVIGIPPSSSEHPEPVIVLYAMTNFDVTSIKAARPSFVETTHNNETYYLDAAQSRAAYFPDSAVLVYATEAHIQSMIESGGVSAAASNFTLPSLKSALYATKAPDGFGHPVIDYLTGHPLNSRPDSRGLSAMVVNVDAGFDFFVDVEMSYENSERATEVAEQMNTDVQDLIAQMDTEREERLLNDYPFKMDAGGSRRFFTRQQDALKSFEASSSGSEVYADFTASNFFPEFAFTDLEAYEFQDVIGFDLGAENPFDKLDAAAPANPVEGVVP